VSDYPAAQVLASRVGSPDLPRIKELEKALADSKDGAAKMAQIIDLYHEALTKIANSGGRWIDGQGTTVGRLRDVANKALIQRGKISGT